ncbi:hypothetical protein FPZ24_12135 [Sphingomonas panacisoli]|uniref:MobA/MobL protein domain-containing protein n=1 Tax=Sphingomonas panacisoli TaxID=1813879 RepID=A0A5B8LPW3_9SPHN|nr:MobA/MobL family protein [Sphingomonas panacisoli]QDZ09190.1 hypothetical protein FPZ24_12135 [Sphingomonas panacisoli]
MDTLYDSRPFNLRYVVWQKSDRHTPDLLRTHRTAKASWLYIHRRQGTDALGDTPDWSARDDLVGCGRSAPSRAGDPALDGLALWEQADAHALRFRPDEPTCAHVVGSLPIGDTVEGWRHLIEGFCEDHLSSQGMVVDWAIHHRDATGDRPAIKPHWHGIVTTRAYDPAHPECGRIRQNWLRSARTRKRLAELWWQVSGVYPIGHILASERHAAPIEATVRPVALLHRATA